MVQLFRPHFPYISNFTFLITFLSFADSRKYQECNKSGQINPISAEKVETKLCNKTSDFWPHKASRTQQGAAG